MNKDILKTAGAVIFIIALSVISVFLFNGGGNKDNEEAERLSKNILETVTNYKSNSKAHVLSWESRKSIAEDRYHKCQSILNDIDKEFSCKMLDEIEDVEANDMGIRERASEAKVNKVQSIDKDNIKVLLSLRTDGIYMTPESRDSSWDGRTIKKTTITRYYTDIQVDMIKKDNKWKVLDITPLIEHLGPISALWSGQNYNENGILENTKTEIFDGGEHTTNE